MSKISLSPPSLPLFFSELLDWLFARTNYENFKVVPKQRYQENLALFREFLDFAGAPDRQLTIVHVAGTKGKGSVCFLLEHLVRTCGYKTGLFTSPHLESILERFMLQGTPCDETTFARVFNRLLAVWIDFCRQTDRDPDAPGLTFFEWSVAIAFEMFSGQKVDCVLLETGLGGRFDATNVCLPAVSVITSISYDHQDILGNTLKEIALEKAGIVKLGVPLVFCIASPLLYPLTEAENHAVLSNGSRPIVASDVQELRTCILTIAHEHCSPAYEITEILPGLQSVPMTLPGLHERMNATIAEKIAGLLQDRLPLLNNPERCKILSQATVPGRMECIATDPTIVIDGAHNRMSFRALAATISRSFPLSRKTLLFGASAGKDIEGMFYELIPCFDSVCFVTASDSSRAVPVSELLDRWHAFIESLPTERKENPTFVHPSDSRSAGQTTGITLTNEIPSNKVIPEVKGIANLAAFLDSFCQNGEKSELLCVSGSFYLIGEVRRLILHRP